VRSYPLDIQADESRLGFRIEDIDNDSPYPQEPEV
jgi:hypothetical protein